MNTKNVENLLYAMIAAVFILALLGASQGLINFVVNLFASAITGTLISLVLGTLIEAVTGDLLKGFLLSVEIYGFEFSVSLFVIATVLLKFVLFR